MESTDSVRAFASRCATLPRLDIVILNAGGMPPVVHDRRRPIARGHDPNELPLSRVAFHTASAGAPTAGAQRAAEDDLAARALRGGIGLDVRDRLRDGSRPQAHRSVVYLAHRRGAAAGYRRHPLRRRRGRPGSGEPWLALERSGDQAVSCHSRLASREVLADSISCPASLYTEDGRAFGERLWDETIEVLGPVGAANVRADLQEVQFRGLSFSVGLGTGQCQCANTHNFFILGEDTEQSVQMVHLFLTSTNQLLRHASRQRTGLQGYPLRLAAIPS